MITIPSLNDVTDILDTDMIMVTQQSGQSYKIAGSEINKRGKIIIANGTTITGAPLKAGSSVRVYFTVDLTAANASTTLQLNYNNVNYYVKAPKDGTLINFVATNLGGSPAVYKYLQKYTTLELLFDGTQFVIIGNPVILSSADYTIYADGIRRIDSVTSGSKNMVTSGAVSALIKGDTDIPITPASGCTVEEKLSYSTSGDFVIIDIQGVSFDRTGYRPLCTLPFTPKTRNISVLSNTSGNVTTVFNETNSKTNVTVYIANTSYKFYGQIIMKI